MVSGLSGAVFGVSAIIGPIIGGAFTSSDFFTWRWCFYINLPIGLAAMAVIVMFLHTPDAEGARLPMAEKLRQLDFPGTILVVSGVACFILALHWGGSEYAVSKDCRWL